MEEVGKKIIKDVNYNTNQKVKVIEKKVDDMNEFMTRTVDTWMTFIKEMKDQQKKTENQLLQMEKTQRHMETQMMILRKDLLNLRKAQMQNVITIESREDSLNQIPRIEDIQESDEENIGLDYQKIPIQKSQSFRETPPLSPRINVSVQEDESRELIRRGSRKALLVKNEEEKNMVSNESKGYKEIKIETFDIPDEFVRRCLDMNCMAGDMKLFRKMYIEGVPKEFLPIRHIKKKFQYWLDGHMNDDDVSGTYIKNTIIRNIEILYLKVNTYENYLDNLDKFLYNQDYIGKMIEEKNKEKILQQIIPIINI